LALDALRDPSQRQRLVGVREEKRVIVYFVHPENARKYGHDPKAACHDPRHRRRRRSSGSRDVGQASPLIREQHHVDVVIANGENAAGGFGLTGQTARRCSRRGRLSDLRQPHLDKREFRGSSTKPTGSSGRQLSARLARTRQRDRRGRWIKVGILNVMAACSCGRRRSVSRRARDGRDAARADPIVVVDMHAEATSEKMAMGRFLDGSYLSSTARTRTSKRPTSRSSAGVRPTSPTSA